MAKFLTEREKKMDQKTNTKTNKTQPKVRSRKHFAVQVNLLVEAYTEEDAQTNALAALGYARRMLDCPLGAAVKSSKELKDGHKQWMTENKTRPFDLVVPKPKLEQVVSAPKRIQPKSNDQKPESNTQKPQPQKKGLVLSKLEELELRQKAWMQGNGPKLTDKELEELCNLRGKTQLRL